MKESIAVITICISVVSGCAQFQPAIDTAISQAASVNHAQYQVAELILCRGMSIGEWMRSIGQYPEKVNGWRSLCVGDVLPAAPLPRK